MALDPAACLPDDGLAGTLIARVWSPAERGPCVALVAPDGVFDITRAYPTVTRLLDEVDPAGAARGALRGTRLGDVAALMANSVAAQHDATKPHPLAPADRPPG